MELVFAHHSILVIDAHITMATVIPHGLAEVVEQLVLSANLVVAGIVDHGINSLLELFQPLFIDFFGDDDVFRLSAVAGVGDEWGLALGDEVKNLSLAESFQAEIDLASVKLGL